MRILLTGASGLIGAQLCAHLITAGYEVVGVARHTDAPRRKAPAVRWLALDMAKAGPDDWAAALAGVGAVVNCAGALQDGPGDDLAAIHAEGLARLAAACAANGVRRLVQISAAGVATAPGPFSRTKAEGDAALAGTDLDWVVLRPGLVLGPVAYGGSALLRGLAAFPAFIPAVHAGAVTQIVATDDLARIVCAMVEPDAPRRVILEVGAAEETSLADILRGLRAWLGLPPAPVIDLPPALARLTAIGADALAWLGWRSPLRSTTLGQLAHGVRTAPSPDLRDLGLQPASLQAFLHRHPAGVQDRWFAQLYFLKPLALIGLSAFWLTSGLVGLMRVPQAAELLTSAGYSAPAAGGAVIGGAIADLTLGALVAFRRTARIALLGMVAVTLAYLAGAAIWRPDLWLDPLGPMVKAIPAALLALVALAMLEDR